MPTYRENWADGEILFSEDLNDTFKKAKIQTSNFEVKFQKNLIRKSSIIGTLLRDNFNHGETAFFFAENSFSLYAPQGYIWYNGTLNYQTVNLSASNVYSCFAGERQTANWHLPSLFLHYTLTFNFEPWDIFFKPDGTKMYLLQELTIYQYSLSTPWDITTSTLEGEKNINNIAPFFCIFFKSDGSAVYLGDLSGYLKQYSLSTPWVITTMDSNPSRVKYIGGPPTGLFFKPDGTKMYAVAADAQINQYALSTAWDISTASLETSLGNIGTIYGHFFKNDGTKLYIVFGAETKQYSLSTPWYVNTASYDGIFITNEPGTPRDVFFKQDDGTKMYIVYGDKKLVQYVTKAFIVNKMS